MRHKSALDVAAEQVLGYRTRAGGENRSRAYPGDPQLLRSNVCAPQHKCDFSSRMTRRFNLYLQSSIWNTEL